MSDVIPDSTQEYASVKIIVRRGNEEVIYDLPMVEHVMVDTKYEEPDIIVDWKPIDKEPKIESFSISMQPLKVDGVNGSFYYRIMRTNHAIERKTNG